MAGRRKPEIRILTLLLAAALTLSSFYCAPVYAADSTAAYTVETESASSVETEAEAEDEQEEISEKEPEAVPEPEETEPAQTENCLLYTSRCV